MDPHFEPWGDPLGTVPWLPNTPVTEVAPEFCRLFGQNVYMVRKYVWWWYAIDPRTTLGIGGMPWLFAPDGPPSQQALVELERKIGPTQYLACLLGEQDDLHRVMRVERVLRWLEATINPRVDREWSLTGNLATPDDYVVEAIVAFLVSACAGVPASGIRFLPAGGKLGHRTHDFSIEADDLAAMLEVKHVLKFPQDASEHRWLRAFLREAAQPKEGMPHDALRARMAQELEGPTDRWAALEELPWQKSVESIKEKLEEAEEQLASAPGGSCKVIVLYSDDPHTLTRGEEEPGQEVPSENRVEKAVESFLGSEAHKHADCVVIVASPFGFPIGSGHFYKAYAKDGHVPEPVRRMFSCLKPLTPWYIPHCAIGLSMRIPPGETGSARISSSNVEFDPECEPKADCRKDNEEAS